MKTTITHILPATILLAMLLAGCSNDIETLPGQPQGAGKTVTLTASHSDPTTRLSYAPGDKGLAVTWKAADSFVLFQGAGKSTFTLLGASVDTKIGEFTGQGLTGTDDYHAFFPAGKAGNSWGETVISMHGQAQTGANSADHLTGYDIMTAAIPVADWGNVFGRCIAFQRRIAVLRFKMELPVGEKPASLALTTNDSQGIRISEKADGTSPVYAGSLSLTLSGVETNIFTAYLAVLPTTLAAGSELKVKVESNTGDLYTYQATLPTGGADYKAGGMYSVALGATGGLSLRYMKFTDAVAAKTLGANYVGYALAGETGETNKGTADNPYLIRSADDLKFMQLQVNNGVVDNSYRTACYKLDTDIQVTATTWDPIGNRAQGANQFMGVFDGNHHTISGKLEGSSKYFGFFGQTNGTSANKAIVKNLYVTADISSSTGAFIGGIIGVFDGHLECTNCTVSGNILAENATYSYIGGIVGSSNIGTSLISDCKMYGSITANNTAGDIFVGGIIGSNYTNSPITNCSNEGDISIISTGEGRIYFGGIVGASGTNSSITNCTNRGNITSVGNASEFRAGGISGWADYISGCANYGELRGKNTNSSGDFRMGGIVGFYEDAGAIMHTSWNYSTKIEAQEGNNTPPDKTQIGRLVGKLSSGTIYNCCSSVVVGTLPLVGSHPNYTLQPCPDGHTTP